MPLVNRLNCKSKSGRICVFVRDALCKYVHVEKILLVQVIVYFGFQLMTDYYLLKHCLELFIFHLRIVYIVTMKCFLKLKISCWILIVIAACFGDFNSHTGNVKEFTEIDRNIFEFCNIPDEEQFLLNNLHILEECNVPCIRYSLDKHKVDRYGQRLLELCKS